MKQTITVEGMHCNACEKLITLVLEDEEILVNNISYKNGRVSIEYDNTKISLNKIKQIMEREGYKLK
ncbi:MAG: heavy-metal-associated domain-containing protein [Nanoarchaeota archaeon]|nr:heavy-metal-associated domain-containing protein [Nanoarchaeota archaeon]